MPSSFRDRPPEDYSSQISGGLSYAASQLPAIRQFKETDPDRALTPEEIGREAMLRGFVDNWRMAGAVASYTRKHGRPPPGMEGLMQPQADPSQGPGMLQPPADGNVMPQMQPRNTGEVGGMRPGLSSPGAAPTVRTQRGPAPVPPGEGPPNTPGSPADAGISGPGSLSGTPGMAGATPPAAPPSGGGGGLAGMPSQPPPVPQQAVQPAPEPFTPPTPMPRAENLRGLQLAEKNFADAGKVHEFETEQQTKLDIQHLRNQASQLRISQQNLRTLLQEQIRTSRQIGHDTVAMEMLLARLNQADQELTVAMSGQSADLLRAVMQSYTQLLVAAMNGQSRIMSGIPGLAPPSMNLPGRQYSDELGQFTGAGMEELRKLWATRLQQAGMSPEDVQKILGIMLNIQPPAAPQPSSRNVQQNQNSTSGTAPVKSTPPAKNNTRSAGEDWVDRKRQEKGGQ